MCGSILDRICEEDHLWTLNKFLDIAFKKGISVNITLEVVDVQKSSLIREVPRRINTNLLTQTERRKATYSGKNNRENNWKLNKGYFACGKFKHDCTKC